MHSVVVVVILAVVQFLGLDAVYVDIREYRGYVQRRHNFYRSQEGAADMKYMSYDLSLERAAQRWADRCVFEHQMRGYGENLAFFSSTGPTPFRGYVIEESMRQWYNERPLYRFGSASCGAACHYTQMVWARTSRLGCAMSYCNALSDGRGRVYRNAQYFVCFYSPQGNYIGQAPYTPGPACSRCPPGNSCFQGLCYGPEVEEGEVSQPPINPP